MNKLSKYISGISLITGLILLLNTHSAKSNFNNLKTSIIKSRQLLNRLIQQLKVTKHDSANLKLALQKMNLEPIKRHLNNFNNQLKPELKKIQDTSQKMKK